MQTLRDSAAGARAAGLGAAIARLAPRHGSRPTSHLTSSRLSSRLAASVAVCALVAPLAGCATPHLEARNTDATRLGACESAYLTAQAGTGGDAGTADAQPAMMRYLNGLAATDAWLTVASVCTSRFAEGALRSAQVAYRTETLGAALGVASPTPPTVDYGDVVRLDAGADALAAMSLAEDRAGFALEVLAARGVAHATLAASDNHKTAAQRLFSLSGASRDPRQKVYAVDELLAHPDTIEDSAAGVTAPTVSVIEMDCARAYLDAIGGVDDADSADVAAGSDASNGTATYDSTTGSTADDSGSTVDSGTASGSTGSDSTDGSGKTTSPSRKTLAWLARMAAARAWRAMELGYPSADSALFR